METHRERAYADEILVQRKPLFLLLVPKRGLEPLRPKALPPQDSVSTSFTTSAR